jgi:hypothetical protein
MWVVQLADIIELTCLRRDAAYHMPEAYAPHPGADRSTHHRS